MSALAALTLAVNLWIIVNKLATALFALIWRLKIAVFLISLTVILFASLSKLYYAWAFAIICGAGFGVDGAPAGDGNGAGPNGNWLVLPGRPG